MNNIRPIMTHNVIQTWQSCRDFLYFYIAKGNLPSWDPLLYIQSVKILIGFANVCVFLLTL